MAQQYMTDSEAKETVTDLMNRAVDDTVELKRRIADLRADYTKDPWEDTAAQINRLENRLMVRQLEAAALAIAVTKF